MITGPSSLGSQDPNFLSMHSAEFSTQVSFPSASLLRGQMTKLFSEIKT